MRHRTDLLALLTSLLLAACGGSAARAGRVVELEETRVVATRTEGGEVSFDQYSADDLFRQAYALTERGRCEEAVARYDRIVSEFPSSRYVSPALYNAALCLQQHGHLDGAVERYELLLQVVPDSADAKHARLQLTACLIELERWEAARVSAERLLERTDLGSDERLEGMARRAQALLGLTQLETAAEQAEEALAFFRTRRGADAIVDEHFAAAAGFVRAEVIRLRSEALTLPAADAATQHQVLEQRVRLLLDAQRAYFDTIRLTDARWAAAAGYRIGAMYERLYRDVSTAPIPPPSRELSAEALELYRIGYRRELTDRIRPLVRHAIRYWELTLVMVERTGVRSEWVERTRAEVARARELLLSGEPREPVDAASLLGSPVEPTDASTTTPPPVDQPGS